MGRTASRKHAFIVIYQSRFHKDFDWQAAAELYLSEVPQPTAADKSFMERLIKGTLENLTAIDALIAEHAIGWTFDRIGLIDLAILRLAIYEMEYLEDVPISVAINEALGLAKIYSGDDSPSFINGLLGKVAVVNHTKLPSR